MKTKKLFLIILIMGASKFGWSQKSNTIVPNINENYYSSIPAYPDSYSASNVVARAVDGLGFRYYWATKDLKKSDIAFKPSKDSRSTFETLVHIYSLSDFIFLTIFKKSSITDIPASKINMLPYYEIRKRTLRNFERISDRLKRFSDSDLAKIKADKYAFWDLLNGPIEDAVWHSGQIASFRRASGNPMNPNVDYMEGKAN